MVIRNAKQRVTGLLVGSCGDQVNPDRVIKEVLRDFQTFPENDTLQPSSLSKKRKRVVEGFQNNVPEPSRISKRLKQISEGSQMPPLDKALQIDRQYGSIIEQLLSKNQIAPLNYSDLSYTCHARARA